VAARLVWAYSKPVVYKMAYGTDKHPDYYKEHGLPDPHDDDGSAPVAPERSRWRNGNHPARHLLLLRLADLHQVQVLPWTTPWKVTVAIIPVVALTALILLLNVFAPSTADIRVIKYIVPSWRRYADA
jgi:hypothetical protein